VSNSTCVVLGQTVRIVALITPLAVESQAALDYTSSRFVSEWFDARDAVVLAVVLTSWRFFNAFLLFSGVEV